MKTSGTVSQLTDRLEPARERARVGAEHARDRAADVIDDIEPVAAGALRRLFRTIRSLVGALMVVPQVLAGLLGLVSRGLGGVADRGRLLAAKVEEPASLRRRRRARAVGLVAGGFGAGFVTGWILHARLQQPPAPAELDDESPYGEDASPIDVRRPAG
jgi:hypothetical protein